MAELHEVYRKTPPLFTDETGNPDPDGSFIRVPDGKLSRVMAIGNSCAALVPANIIADLHEL